MITLNLPYPPSANRYWRIFRNRAVPSAHATEYKGEVADIIAALDPFGRTYSCSVSVDMVLHPKRPKDYDKRLKKDPLAALTVQRIDLDNAYKVCLDALQGLLYDNDRQVTKLSICLGEPVDEGSMVVTVSPDKRWQRDHDRRQGG